MDNDGLCHVPIPILTRRTYEHCCIHIKVLLKAKGIWDIIVNGYSTPHDMVDLSQEENDTLAMARKKYQLALMFIQQGLGD